MKPLVIVESPYAANTAEEINKNLDYARLACLDCIKRGERPFASHLFYPQILDDNDPDQRQMGIKLGYDFWRAATRIVFYIDLGLSKGMRDALNEVSNRNVQFELRTLSK